jgi:hypothetical protein
MALEKDRTMNYHELITIVQQYLRSGFPVSRDHGRGLLKSLEGAIRDPTTAPRELAELIAHKVRLAALTTTPELSWPGSTTATG